MERRELYHIRAARSARAEFSQRENCHRWGRLARRPAKQQLCPAEKFQGRCAKRGGFFISIAVTMNGMIFFVSISSNSWFNS
jgi:hypothetical protein